MRPTKTLEYVSDPNKFDLQVHRWDNQGHLISKNPYRNFIIEGRSYYERPVNSGNLWFENNQPAGRVECTFNEKGHIATKKFDFDAPHKEWTAPLTGDAKIHFELEQAREQNAALAAELAAIKASKAPLAEKIEKIAEVKIEAKAQAPTLTKRGT
jgi:hypothetical protein